MADPIGGKVMEVLMMFGRSLLFFLIIGVVYVINLMHSLLENQRPSNASVCRQTGN